jgi:hypothetical protein
MKRQYESVIGELRNTTVNRSEFGTMKRQYESVIGELRNTTVDISEFDTMKRQYESVIGELRNTTVNRSEFDTVKQQYESAIGELAELRETTVSEADLTSCQEGRTRDSERYKLKKNLLKGNLTSALESLKRCTRDLGAKDVWATLSCFGPICLCMKLPQ